MTRYLIYDAPGSYDTKFIDGFEALGLTVLSAYDLTERLVACTSWAKFQPEKTLLVFPGKGAQLTRKFIQDWDSTSRWMRRWPWKESVPAKRMWEPGCYPQAYAGRISQAVYVGIRDVVIVDDVISSGETCRKIKTMNHSFIPNARWHAAAWVMQRAANLRGFDSFFCSEMVGEYKSKVPVNSLSTLLEDRIIAASYARRNFNDPKAFLDVLTHIDLYIPSDTLG